MLILFRRRGNNEPLISTRIKRRRLFTVISLVFLLMFSSILVTSKYYNAPTKAIQPSPDNLTISAGEDMYIGAGGYISQRFGRDSGFPEEINYQLPVHTPLPTDHVFTNADVDSYQHCSMGWGIFNRSPRLCYYITGDGTGMIIHFNKKIEINGDLYIGDRVVLEAPEIIIGSTGKIHADGQAGQLGYGDSCGVGGIGGTVGGSSGNYKIPTPQGSSVYTSCPSATDGVKPKIWSDNPYTQILGLNGLSGDVSPFFTSNGQSIVGGSGGSSSGPFAGAAHGLDIGLSSSIGVGGAGPSGATGDTSGRDHGSSGGGGGGFGVVFKASKSFKVWRGASISVKGGNALISSDSNPQDPGHGNTATGGYGGPGGGGVIIIDTPNIVFSIAGLNGEEADIPDYSVLNVEAGIFDVPSNIVSTTRKPGLASPGALVIKSASYSRISKQVSPLNVNPGDDVTVTLTIPVALGAYDVEDEFLNDGLPAPNTHYFTLNSPLPPGCENTTDPHKLTCPGTTTTPIVYHLKAPVY